MGCRSSDHMVLQREKPVAVWGTADPDATAQAAIRLGTNGCFQVWTKAGNGGQGTGNGWVDVAAKGAVAIAGVCNGDPMDYDSLHGDSIKAFRGLAQVILRGAAGELRVSSRETGDRRLSIE